MHDEWTDRLSQFVDAALSDADRRAVEEHLASCAACAAVAAELAAVRDRAAGLADRPPAHDLWAGIAERLETPVIDLAARRAVRRLTFSVPQLAAAGVALMALSAGGAWMLRSPGDAAPPAAVQPAAGFASLAVATGDPAYDATVRDLQLVLETNRALLDSATIRVLEESLAAIDGAMLDAREALARDPANEYLNAHLAGTMRQKVQLLQRAVALAGT